MLTAGASDPCSDLIADTVTNLCRNFCHFCGDFILCLVVTHRRWVAPRVVGRRCVQTLHTVTTQTDDTTRAAVSRSLWAGPVSSRIIHEKYYDTNMRPHTRFIPCNLYRTNLGSEIIFGLP